MKRTAVLIILCLALCAPSLFALDGLFHINSVFQHTSYPLFGSGGKDVLRLSSAGIALKSTRGEGLQGVIDIALLFPYKIEEKIFPAKDFRSRPVGSSIALDGLVGLGYRLSTPPMSYLFSAGFHTGVLLEGASSLVAFGVGLDAQTHVQLGKQFTAQLGAKMALDFGGTQSFSAGSNQFAGLPLSLGFYTGVGLVY